MGDCVGMAVRHLKKYVRAEGLLKLVRQFSCAVIWPSGPSGYLTEACSSSTTMDRSGPVTDARVSVVIANGMPSS